MKIFLTGGSGLLGTELQKHIKVFAPTHEEFDILQPVKGEFDLIIHSAAYTDVTKAEKEREKCFFDNVVGTLRMSDAFENIPFVYISSEYAHKPVNWYSRTKQIAETIAMDHPGGCLAIRTLFKPNVWPFDNAFINQFTMGDTVGIIAPLIVKRIHEWDRKTKLIYVGTGRKTIYDIAKKSKPDVRKSLTTEIKKVKIPTDYQ